MSGATVYAYVDGDPITRTDPSGLMDSVTAACMQDPELCHEIFGQIAHNFAALSNQPCAQEAADALDGALNTVANIAIIAAVLPGIPVPSNIGKTFSAEKQALVDMAKADKRVGITPEDMQAYKDLNRDLPDPFPSNKVRGPEAHTTGAPHSQAPHGHVGPVNHIPIVGP